MFPWLGRRLKQSGLEPIAIGEIEHGVWMYRRER